MSTERLLSKEIEDEGDDSLSDCFINPKADQEANKRICSTSQKFAFKYYFIIHLLLIAAYTTFFFLALYRITSKLPPEPILIKSPAQDAVRYERKFINNDVFSQNVYKGEPRPELDEAWRNMFQHNNIRVTGEELQRMNRTSVQLADGSGDYLAALDVYHHLHCVKMIRQYLHPEYYEMPHSEKVEAADHIDHCLDALRQELMCRAEVTFTTYEWLPDLTIPWAQLSYDHTCVNFEALDEWAASRAIDIFDPKFLVHPTRGTVYPKKEGGRSIHTKY